MATSTTKRCLGIAGMTGGLLLLGAGAAIANDGTDLGNLLGGSSSEGTLLGGSEGNLLGGSSSQGSVLGVLDGDVQGPVSVGGIDVGLSSQSSQSSESTRTVTHQDGTSQETSREQSSSRSDDLGVSVGEITADPAATLDAVVSGTTTNNTRTGTGTGTGSSSGSSEGDLLGAVGAAAPVQVGGADLTATSQSHREVTESTATTGTDGSSQESGHHEATSSSNDLGVSVGEVTADPAGSVGGMLSGSTTDTHHRGSETSGTATGVVDVTSPVHIGGVDLTGDRHAQRTESTWAGTTDANGVVDTTATERQESSATSTGLSTGAITTDPGAVAAGALTGRTDTTRTGNTGAGTTGTTGRSTGSSSGTGAGVFGLAAPVHAEGVSGWTQDQRSSTSWTQRHVQDGDRSWTRTQGRADATRTTGGFDTGAIHTTPALTGAGVATIDNTRTAGRTDHRTGRDSLTRGATAGMLDLTAPFHADGAHAAGSTERAQATWVQETWTQHGTTVTEQRHHQSAHADQLGTTTGPITGDPAGQLWTGLISTNRT